MANKLREIFSEKEEKYIGTMQFKTHEGYLKFTDALQKFYEDGKSFEVKDVDSISLNGKDGDSQYPLEHQKVDKVFIYPTEEEVEFFVETEYGERKVILLMSRTVNSTLFHSTKNAIVELKIIFNSKTKDIKLSYNTHVQKAKSVGEIIEQYVIMLAFIKKYFTGKETDDEIKNIISFFEDCIVYLKRIRQVEEVVGIKFSPIKIIEKEDKEFVLESLYILLVQRKKIRNNDKLNNITQVTIDDISGLEEGKKLVATYMERYTCELFGKEISIYTISCIFNAIISRIEKNEENDMNIYFKDTDSKPMYRSYSGFLDEKKAKEELNIALNKFEEYAEALKFEEHLNKLEVV